MKTFSGVTRLAILLGGLMLAAFSSSVFAFGTANKFVLLTNQDSAYTETGTWSTINPSGFPAGTNPTFYGEFYRVATGSGGGITATGNWDFGVIASAPGSYSFDAFIPDTNLNSGTAVVYRLFSAPNSIFTGCGAYTLQTTFSAVNADTSEGRWLPIGQDTLQPGTCYRLQVTNQGNAGAQIAANAVRAERLFETVNTIPDMARVTSSFAAGTTAIPSALNGSPTIVTTLSITCPYAGQVLVTGSGESAAVSNAAGGFNGLAYSISKDSTATDNGNVVQSSALNGFAGDANRDFLNVQRLDSCTAGQTIVYRLTAYRAQAATGPGSFVWNGRLVANFFTSATF